MKKSLLSEIATSSDQTKTRGTVFKTWCIQNGISQTKIQHKTKLSIATIHHLWNDGKASKSTVMLLSFAYAIDQDYLLKMITTFDVDSKKTKQILNSIKQRAG